MANRNSYNSKLFHIVIEEYDLLNDKLITERDLDNYCRQELRFKFYAFIKHDSDRDVDNNKVRNHYHLIVICNQSYSKNTIINSISSGLFVNTDIVSVRKINSFVACIRYLVHKDTPDKCQYTDLDIWTSDLNEVNMCLYENSSSFDLEIEYLSLLVKNCKSLTELYLTLGLQRSKLYRSLIIDMWKEEHIYGYYD